MVFFGMLALSECQVGTRPRMRECAQSAVVRDVPDEQFLQEIPDPMTEWNNGMHDPRIV